MAYFAALMGCGVFWLIHGEWVSAVLLAVVLGLPWLSLILSLPGILSFRAECEGPEHLTLGDRGEIWLLGSGRLAMPPFRGFLRLKSRITGESRLYDPRRGLCTDHCGGLEITIEKCRVHDYLGLFSFPAKTAGPRTLVIRPRAVPVTDLPDRKKLIPRSWRPKPGGGFAENHELRLYRPGDSLNQVHWKLTAKTGRLTVREPMEPHRGLNLLTMDLSGEPDTLDRKLGQLLWAGTRLVEGDSAFELRVLTGDGVRSFSIGTKEDLDKALDALLCAPMAREGSIRDHRVRASWQYHIGGDANET